MNLSLKKLTELKEEYLLTLDDSVDDESWCTERVLSTQELDKFFIWLSNRNKKK